MKTVKKNNKIGGRLSNLGGKAACGTFGLTLALQGLALAAGDTFGQLKAMAIPDAEADNAISVPSPAVEEARLSFKKRVPAHLQGQLMALYSLARDVVSDPQAGRRFAAGPKDYLAERGLRDVTLDLNSKEVKVILALSDPEVNAAVKRGDTRKYLQLMEDRGLLQLNGLAELSPLEAAVVVLTDVFTYITFVTDPCAYVSCDAVAYIASAVAVDTKGMESRAGDNVLGCLEGKSAALLWGKTAAREMLLQHVAEKADKIAGELSELKTVRKNNLSREQIRAAVERKMLDTLTE